MNEQPETAPPVRWSAWLGESPEDDCEEYRRIMFEFGPSAVPRGRSREFYLEQMSQLKQRRDVESSQRHLNHQSPRGHEDTNDPLEEPNRIQEHCKDGSREMFRYVNMGGADQLLRGIFPTRELRERVAYSPNDPSSATRPTRRVDWNSSAMAGFAAAHG